MQAAGHRRRSAACRTQSGTEITPVGQDDGQREQDDDHGKGHGQRPPTQVHEETSLLGPGEGGEPGQPGTGVLDHVTHASEQVGHGNSRHGHAGGAAGVLGQLGGHSGQASEDQTRQGGAGTKGQRTVQPQVLMADGYQPQGGGRTDEEAGQRHGRSGRSGRSETADRQGSDHLQASGFLLRAGVADCQEDGHDGGSEEHVEAEFVGHHGTEGVVVRSEGRPGHHDGGRVGQQGTARLDGLFSGEGLVQRVHRSVDAEPHRDRPDEEADPVESEVEPQQRAGPGERGTGLRRRMGGARPQRTTPAGRRHRDPSRWPCSDWRSRSSSPSP
ncbi:hypothetical protein ACFFX0_04740 [Citricoccus parietis]|uniref:Uncharacterized protein n=1 Tax=Citricoccus parietis TaxID=592307 RepID=A0ABV5FV35_9MICC